MAILLWPCCLLKVVTPLLFPLFVGEGKDDKQHKADGEGGFEIFDELAEYQADGNGYKYQYFISGEVEHE